MRLTDAHEWGGLFSTLGWRDHLDDNGRISPKSWALRRLESDRAFIPPDLDRDPWVFAVALISNSRAGKPQSGTYWGPDGRQSRLAVVSASRTGFALSAQAKKPYLMQRNTASSSVWIPYATVDSYSVDFKSYRIAVRAESGAFEFKYKPPVAGWSLKLDALTGPGMILGSFANKDAADDLRTAASLYMARSVAEGHASSIQSFESLVGGFFEFACQNLPELRRRAFT